MVADRLEYVADELEKAVAGGTELHKAVQDLLGKMIKEAKPVIFNGDNYTDEWHQEAERRGLPNLKNTPDALDVLKSEKAIKLLSKGPVYTKREIESRYNILAEQYVSTIGIEAGMTGHIAKTMILPAAVRYAKELADGVTSMKSAGVGDPAGIEELTFLNTLIGDLTAGVKKLDAALAKEHPEDPSDAAKFMRDEVLSVMGEIRNAGDALEDVVADDLWPLPTYREMLFIR